MDVNKNLISFFLLNFIDSYDRTQKLQLKTDMIITLIYTDMIIHEKYKKDERKSSGHSLHLQKTSCLKKNSMH